MIDYFDSISMGGWGKLLITFVPSNMNVFIADVIFFLIIPLLFIFLLIGFCKNHFPHSRFGVWRSAGKTWFTIGGISLAAIISLYFIFNVVLTTSLSGVTSLETQYRKQLVTVTQNEAFSPDHSRNMRLIAEKIRNKSLNSSSVNASDNSNLQSEVGDQPGDRINSIKENKLTDKQLNEFRTGGLSSSPAKTTIHTVSRFSPEYKVVKVFYNGYGWLHHLIYVIAWIVFILWFFWPGLKMKNQQTLIKN